MMTTTEQQETQPVSDAQSRVNRSLAVQRYVHADERYQDALRAFGEACQEVRDSVQIGSRFITKVDYVYYLVTVDDDGQFDVVRIEVV